MDGGILDNPISWLSSNALSIVVFALSTALFFYVLGGRGGATKAADGGSAKTVKIGDVTVEDLAKYDGSDTTKPILLAVRGAIFDVTAGRDFYGPGAGYGIFAGNECSRALAMMSLQKEDVSGDLTGVTEDQMGFLKEWEDKFNDKYPVVGRVIASKQLTPEELALHDGRDDSKPILLSVRGMLFDVSKGRDFYGPEGAYPFAGKEVARALAKTSLDPADFNAELEDLSHTEMGILGDWERKFRSKYPVVGKLLTGSSSSS